MLSFELQRNLLKCSGLMQWRQQQACRNGQRCKLRPDLGRAVLDSCQPTLCHSASPDAERQIDSLYLPITGVDAALGCADLHKANSMLIRRFVRPSIDPELMMLVVGYVFAIRSEPLIRCEVQVNLADRWFCKLGIEDAVPDHSASSRARNERFREGDVFRRVFERVVEACIAADLVGGKGFAVDASLIQADTNQQRSAAGQDGGGIVMRRGQAAR
jgi:transposase